MRSRQCSNPVFRGTCTTGCKQSSRISIALALYRVVHNPCCTDALKAVSQSIPKDDTMLSISFYRVTRTIGHEESSTGWRWRIILALNRAAQALTQRRTQVCQSRMQSSSIVFRVTCIIGCDLSIGPFALLDMYIIVEALVRWGSQSSPLGNMQYWLWT
jgi:hypothetical protein